MEIKLGKGCVNKFSWSIRLKSGYFPMEIRNCFFAKDIRCQIFHACTLKLDQVMNTWNILTLNERWYLLWFKQTKIQTNIGSNRGSSIESYQRILLGKCLILIRAFWIWGSLWGASGVLCNFLWIFSFTQIFKYK